jgi:hypothetical protein
VGPAEPAAPETPPVSNAQPDSHKPVWIDGSEWQLRESSAGEEEKKAGTVIGVTARSTAEGIGAAFGVFKSRGLKRVATLAAVIAAGVYLYPHIKPMLGGLGPLSSTIAAKLESFGKGGGASGAGGNTATTGGGGGGSSTVYLRSSAVNMRGGPSMESKVVGVVQQGATIRRIEKQANWVRIRTAKGKTGWVHNSLVSDRPVR